jgi:hypothetical protein
MTCAAWEWFMGRYEDELEDFWDPHVDHPVWKMWWFQGSIAAACICTAWFFWPSVM